MTECGARAMSGPCTLPAGHNMGLSDVPGNHAHGTEDLNSCCGKVMTANAYYTHTVGAHGWGKEDN